MSTRKGFTLIELLVVVSIIALLVAILMPALGSARRQATGAVCLSNQKALAMAWVMYADDNDGRLVGGSTYNYRGDDWVTPPVNDPTLSKLEQELEGIRQGKLYKYVNTTDVYHCPGDKRELRSTVTTRNPNGWLCYRSYGIVGTMNGEHQAAAIKREIQLRSPAEKVVFLEETDDRGWNMGSWIMDVTPNSYRWIDPLTIWHNKQGTLGFADGHAEMHRWEDERTLEAAQKQLFNVVQRDNPDWLYMWRGYVHKK